MQPRGYDPEPTGLAAWSRLRSRTWPDRALSCDLQPLADCPDVLVRQLCLKRPLFHGRFCLNPYIWVDQCGVTTTSSGCALAWVRAQATANRARAKYPARGT